MTKLLVLIICVPMFALAQATTEDVDLIQALYGKEKKLIVSDFIHVEGPQQEAFWRLYDEYELKRKELGKKRVELFEMYVNNFETLDPARTTQIINETAALGAKTDKLVLSYHKKMEKEVGAKAAAQFYELELYFLSAIRLAVFENLPFIHELK
jgi:hypothetical protein